MYHESSRWTYVIKAPFSYQQQDVSSAYFFCRNPSFSRCHWDEYETSHIRVFLVSFSSHSQKRIVDKYPIPVLLSSLNKESHVSFAYLMLITGISFGQRKIRKRYALKKISSSQWYQEKLWKPWSVRVPRYYSRRMIMLILKSVPAWPPSRHLGSLKMQGQACLRTVASKTIIHWQKSEQAKEKFKAKHSACILKTYIVITVASRQLMQVSDQFKSKSCQGCLC